MRHHVFRLSSRQKKELYDRRSKLLIALPLSADEFASLTVIDGEAHTGNALALAAELLPDVDETIQGAELDCIQVNRALAGGRACQSLTECLGARSTPHETPSGAMISIRLQVLLVTLSHGDARHDSTADWQWPGNIVLANGAFYGGAQPPAE